MKLLLLPISFMTTFCWGMVSIRYSMQEIDNIIAMNQALAMREMLDRDFPAIADLPDTPKINALSAKKIAQYFVLT